MLLDTDGFSFDAPYKLTDVVKFAAIIAFNIFLCWLLNKGGMWLEEKLSKSKFIIAIEKREGFSTLLGIIIVAIPLIVVLYLGYVIGYCVSNDNQTMSPEQEELIINHYGSSNANPN